jgi:hypothetical protein
MPFGSRATAFTTAAVPAASDSAPVVAAEQHVVLEVDVRARIVLATVERDRLVWAAQALPARDRTGVDAAQLLDRQLLHRILLVQIDREAVARNRDLDAHRLIPVAELALLVVLHRA